MHTYLVKTLQQIGHYRRPQSAFTPTFHLLLAAFCNLAETLNYKTKLGAIAHAAATALPPHQSKPKS